MDNPNTMTYEFTLVYELPRPECEPAAYVDALYEAGCDDALVGIGTIGKIALAFTREAESRDAAVTSANADVLKAIPGARLTSTHDGLPT